MPPVEINSLVLKRLRALEHYAVYVYLYLERVRSVDLGEWFDCSPKDLLEELGLSDKTLRAALRRLSDLDIIEVDLAATRHVATRVRIVDYSVDNSTSKPVDNKSTAGAYPAVTPRVFRLTDEDVQVRDGSAGGNPAVEETAACSLGTRPVSLGGSAEGGDERFDAFWSAYPRKVAKPVARKSFEKAIEKVSFDVILDGVTRYTEYVSRPDGPTVAHASTWLNQERWTDEYPAPKRKSVINSYAAQRGADYYDDV